MTREEAIAKINRLRNEYNDQYIDYCGVNEAVNMAIEALKAEPKRGRWVREPNCWYRCAVCGDHYPSIADNMKYNYCPNCGALMEKQEGD